MINKPELIAIMMAGLPDLSLIDSDIINSFYTHEWTKHEINVI